MNDVIRVIAEFQQSSYGKVLFAFIYSTQPIKMVKIPGNCLLHVIFYGLLAVINSADTNLFLAFRKSRTSSPHTDLL